MNSPSSSSNSDSGKGAFQTPGYDLSPGMVILDTYEVLAPLGRGGMGAVYLVYHRFLQKEMAMKVLRSNQLMDSTWRRFQTEAKAIAKLEHPNIVRIFDMGISEDGQAFYTMELLKGQGLDEWTRRNPISITQTLFVFRQVASGLAFAHERGIIHRDIKPANIVLTFAEANQPPVVKVVDFGIAKLASDDQGLTKEGEVFGSPLYMSPEQASGLKIDHRSDIYSLGCAFYETLTGFPPFKGKSAVETMIMHVDMEAVPIERVRPEVNYPQGLSMVVKKCMAKQADCRYSDASQLAQDVLKIEQGHWKESFASQDHEPVSERGHRGFGGLEERDLERALQQETGSDWENFTADSSAFQDMSSSSSRRRMGLWARSKVLIELLGFLLLGGTLGGLYFGAEQMREWGRRPEEGQKISCPRLYESIDHFRLTASDLQKLNLKESPKESGVYYLFPEDGVKSIGYLVPVEAKPPLKPDQCQPAAGLIVFPVDDSRLRLVISTQLALNPQLLGRFKSGDLMTVSLPLPNFEGSAPVTDGRLADCRSLPPSSVCALNEVDTCRLLTELRHIPGIESFYAGYAHLNAKCIAELGGMSSLNTLMLDSSTLSPDASLENLANLNDLISITLPSGEDPCPILRRLGKVSKLKFMQAADFNASKVQSTKFPPIETLEEVRLNYVDVSEAFLRDLSACPNLKRLDFRQSLVAKGGGPILLSMKKLESLVLPKDIAKIWGAEKIVREFKKQAHFSVKLDGM